MTTTSNVKGAEARKDRVIEVTQSGIHNEHSKMSAAYGKRRASFVVFMSRETGGGW